MLIDVAIRGDRNAIKKEAEKILKHLRPHNRSSAYVECESKGDTGNNRGDWKHFKIIQTIPKQYTRKSRN